MLIKITQTHENVTNSKQYYKTILLWKKKKRYLSVQLQNLKIKVFNLPSKRYTLIVWAIPHN